MKSNIEQSGRPRRRKKRSKLSAILVSILLVLVVGTGAAFAYAQHLLSPVGSTHNEVKVSIEPGSSSSAIALRLKEAGLIRNETAFKIYLRYRNVATSLQAGSYTFYTDMSLPDLVEALRKGVKREEIVVTIKEGWDINRIGKYLEGVGLFTAQEFQDEIRNNFPYYRDRYAFLAYVPESRDLKLEGYLSGDTFFVYPDASPRDLILLMLDRFESALPADYVSRAASLGYTVDQVVTMASITEREGILDEELPVIASVFYNRLASDSYPYLQSCATLQYIYEDYRFTFSNAEMKIDNPYNTYKYPGLPPGPISNIRDSALQAAFYPASTNYFYFCSKNDGTGGSAFAATYSEHQKNVSKYLR